jgi:hypothetical protein
VAARLRKELRVPIERLSGAYGEFTVLVGDEVVLTGGPLGWLGVLPSAEDVLEKVRARLHA